MSIEHDSSTLENLKKDGKLIATYLDGGHTIVTTYEDAFCYFRTDKDYKFLWYWKVSRETGEDVGTRFYAKDYTPPCRCFDKFGHMKNM